jgi:hypothetical protein
MKTTEITPEKKANYIIDMIKSVGKTKEYAISIAVWYCMNEKEQKEVEEIIKLKF